MADANGHLSSCGLPPLLAWILLAGEQAQLEVAFNDVLIGHAAAPLAWRGHQRRQGDWRPQLVILADPDGPRLRRRRVVWAYPEPEELRKRLLAFAAVIYSAGTCRCWVRHLGPLVCGQRSNIK